MMKIGEITVIIMVIASVNAGITNNRFLVEAERKWFLRALAEEQEHIRRELLASAVDGDLPRLEAALKDSCPTWNFGQECLDINVTDNEGRTPLIIAAINGHVEVVKALLKDKRTDVN